MTLTAGGVNQFSAHLQNSSDQTVTWSLSPQLGTVDSNGLYTAPQSISAAQDVILTATSVTDPQKFATAKITLIPLTVSVNPGSATLRAGQAMQFAAGATNALNGNAFRRVVFRAPATSYSHVVNYNREVESLASSGHGRFQWTLHGSPEHQHRAGCNSDGDQRNGSSKVCDGKDNIDACHAFS